MTRYIDFNMTWLYKYHTVSRYTPKCNSLYAQKKSTAFPALILTENRNCSPTLHKEVPRRILNKSDTISRQCREIPFPPLPMFTKLVTLLGDLLYWTSLSSRSKCFKTLEGHSYDNKLHFQFQTFRVSVAPFPNVQQSVTFARQVNKTQPTSYTRGYHRFTDRDRIFRLPNNRNRTQLVRHQSILCDSIGHETSRVDAMHFMYLEEGDDERRNASEY
jgi:hypothetical protein